jgi:multidrug efflux system outer membrane protein
MDQRRIRRSMVAAALAATVAGCALNPPPTRDDLRRDALPHTAIPEAWKAGGGAAAPVADHWLATFGDPVLSALVAEALAFNADVEVAAARVEQAAGYVAVASGSLLPTVGLAATQSGNSGGGGGLNAVFLNASLELDVWGTRGSRWRRMWPRRGSSPSRPVCSARSHRTCCALRSRCCTLRRSGCA